MAEPYVSVRRLGTFLTQIKNLFVAKETGKGLSTNDYTTAEKEKLAGIAAGAQVNTIETVQVNGSPVTPSQKVVNIDLSSYALKSDVTGAMHIKGTVTSYADLPESPEDGDAYSVTTADPTHGIEAGEIVMWTGTEWVDMGGTIDLSAYLTSESAAETYQTKQSLDNDVSELGFLKKADLSEYQKTSELDTSVGALGYMKTTAADAKYQTITGMTDYMKVADYPEATDEQIEALFTV